VAGYLVSGLVIGRSGSGLLQNSETTRFLLTLGVSEERLACGSGTRLTVGGYLQGPLRA
jgi:hypothetical protein